MTEYRLEVTLTNGRVVTQDGFTEDQKEEALNKIIEGIEYEQTMTLAYPDSGEVHVIPVASVLLVSMVRCDD
jgi:hypothetical protein